MGWWVGNECCAKAYLFGWFNLMRRSCSLLCSWTNLEVILFYMTSHLQGISKVPNVIRRYLREIRGLGIFCFWGGKCKYCFLRILKMMPTAVFCVLFKWVKRLRFGVKSQSIRGLQIPKMNIVCMQKLTVLKSRMFNPTDRSDTPLILLSYSLRVTGLFIFL